MRCPILASTLFLSSPILAVPSPTSGFLEPCLQEQQSSIPRWRAFTNGVVGTLFGQNKVEEPLPFTADRRTLAQYGADVVLRFTIDTADEAEALKDAADVLLLDIWQFAHHWVDIRLATDIVPALIGLLPASLASKHAPILRERELVQAVYDQYPHRDIPTQTPHSSREFSHNLQGSGAAAKRQESNIFFSDYQPLSVIEPWMRLLSSLFNTHVRMISVGHSHEGRPISALRVGVHPTNDDDPDAPKRRTILISGGSHAREWISTSTVNYAAYSLITGYGKNQMITKLLEAFDFVFVPTINPDGYQYSWTTDRLWRKNRQPTATAFCHGIDLDRSYGFEWDATTSGNPCSESFAGSEAFEATETKTFAEWAKNETDNNNVTFVGFLDLHSYSQSILYPYSYSCTDYPPGLENLEELAYGLERAIRISGGHSYEIMPACEGNAVMSKNGEKQLLPRQESSGGSALDFFYHELHIPYAYQIKLRDRGTYGFLLPKEHIVPTGKEILDAVLEMANFLEGLYSAGISQDDVETEVEQAADESPDDQEPLSRKGTSIHTSDVDEEEDLESAALFDAGSFDPEHVKWDLKRRRRR